jgi:hypothetical protein
MEMNCMNRLAGTAVIAVAAALAGMQAQAASGERLESGPRWEDQALDAVVARPLGILATGAGAVVWGISLPFSLLGGNAGEAADKLVGGPGRETFVRCLGCRSEGRRQRAQDDQ